MIVLWPGSVGWIQIAGSSAASPPWGTGLVSPAAATEPIRGGVESGGKSGAPPAPVATTSWGGLAASRAWKLAPSRDRERRAKVCVASPRMAEVKSKLAQP